MNIADVAARLQELPPDLSEPVDRFQQVQERVRKRRTRRLAGTAVVAVAAVSVLVPTILHLRSDPTGEPSRDIASDPSSPQTATPPAGAAMPGTDRVIELSTPLTTQGTGTSTVQLGERPVGATAVSTDLRCLSAGTFRWPDGASMTCNAEDAAAPGDHAVSPGYIVNLDPEQSEIVIRSGPNESWQVVTTYVRTERIEWGVNARGETYGAENEDGSPDLVAIAGPDGETYYGKKPDLNAGPSTPDEAGLWMENGELYAIPTYAADGTTIVGTFEFSEAISSGQPAGPTRDDVSLINGAPPRGATRASVTGLLTVSDNGCVHLDTEAGKRWLILPWGVYLSGTPADGRLQALDGTPIAELNADATITGEELPDQLTDVPCATDLPPLYVTDS